MSAFAKLGNGANLNAEQFLGEVSVAGLLLPIAFALFVFSSLLACLGSNWKTPDSGGEVAGWGRFIVWALSSTLLVGGTLWVRVAAHAVVALPAGQYIKPAEYAVANSGCLFGSVVMHAGNLGFGVLLMISYVKAAMSPTPRE